MQITKSQNKAKFPINRTLVTQYANHGTKCGLRNQNMVQKLLGLGSPICGRMCPLSAAFWVERIEIQNHRALREQRGIFRDTPNARSGIESTQVENLFDITFFVIFT